MSDFREIFVKAVCGRSRHSFHDVNLLKTDHSVNEVLGCRITNHRYAGMATSSGVKINGSYDAHVWYTHSRGQNTTVLTKTIEYSRGISYEELGIDPNECSDPEAVVRLTHGPFASSVKLEGNSNIKVTVDMGYLVEVIGDTRLCVKHYPGACDDGFKKDFLDVFDDDDLEDEYTESFDEEEDLAEDF
jgi:spore coat protein E